ncbi:hypothetical protein PIB30_020975 [Stylosanthes scabra]|uniref:Peroxidase n=1 Tax=Stylosanthes scabra TaxID=79078 RepID=A0ABU6S8F8_9FABA|nr:hypothetical protein [Stylosanthes scabra]
MSSNRKLGRAPITAKGLDYDYYWISCPRLERIVRKHLEDVFAKDPGQAPGILRLFFHDCFSQGCDASILLDGANDEQTADENIGLRPEAIQTIENLRALVRKQCPRVVSCSDILVIAAREAVRQFGGPDFDVPLGRKDSKSFNTSAATNLPKPFFKTPDLLKSFTDKKLDATDLVALSGAHTYGVSHCGSVFDFEQIIPFNRSTDAPIEPQFSNSLVGKCPNEDSPATIDLDIRTPNKFDNMYYIDLLNQQGVFISDQDLAYHKDTKEIVNQFASNQKLFFDKFANAFVKASQLEVLTGNDKRGEIRKSCFAPNDGDDGVSSSLLHEVVDSATASN